MREIPAVFSEDFIENRESMKKIFALMLVCILVVFMYSCKDTGNDSDVNSPADDVENQNPTDSKLYFWNRAGKGCGALIPQPKHEYEILRSTDDLYAEVHNITEDDFYAYAMECVQRGFEGEV